MALLDPRHQQIVLRIVYDGPALAGKTTSLRALARALGSEIYSGGEAEGRTLFLDWVDYVGGLFQGMPIHCQLLSVPGQTVLEARRRRLLETADAVVFVADSRPGQREENLRSFAGLQATLRDEDPRPGIVVQANKRDVDQALSLDSLRSDLGDGTMLAMTESVAESGEGVRETFVLAVRLALDRARVLFDRGELPSQEPSVADGPSMVAVLEAQEQKPPAASAAPAASGAAAGASTAPRATTPSAGSSRLQVPPLPDPSIPVGHVWPAIEGRVTLHEATRAAPGLERDRSGSWIGESGCWKLCAPLEGLLFDLEQARAALADWARWHSEAGRRLSSPRSLALMPETDGVWRVWQIVRSVPSLLDTLEELFRQEDDTKLGAGLVLAFEHRLRAERELVESGWLDHLTLDSIGVSARGEVFFTGLSPYPRQPPGRRAPDHRVDVCRAGSELTALVQHQLGLTPGRLPGTLASIRKDALERRQPEIARSLEDALLQS